MQGGVMIAPNSLTEYAGIIGNLTLLNAHPLFVYVRGQLASALATVYHVHDKKAYTRAELAGIAAGVVPSFA